MQQAYTGQTLNKIFDPAFLAKHGGGLSDDDASLASGEDDSLETMRFRQMFEALNASLFEHFEDEITQALVAEREPEAFVADTAAWRTGQGQISPIASAFAKEFDSALVVEYIGLDPLQLPML